MLFHCVKVMLNVDCIMPSEVKYTIIITIIITNLTMMTVLIPGRERERHTRDCKDLPLSSLRFSPFTNCQLLSPSSTNYQFKIITNSFNLWHTWPLTWADCHCRQVRANPHKHQKQSPRTEPGLFLNIIKIVHIKYLKYYTNIINTRGSHFVQHLGCFKIL